MMFIYNITSKVDHAVLDEWLQWQKEIYIPGAMETGFFYEHRFYQLLEHDDEDGKTFVVQFLAKSRNDCDKYLQSIAPFLNKKSFEKWGDYVVYFQTLLQNVD
ncbi:MAG: DUF4286 family protein [Bacteroidota bacterium]|nr:DUF4286 family protein [Bacteroidota bacterium]